MTTKHLIFIMNQKIYSYNKNYVIFLKNLLTFCLEHCIITIVNGKRQNPLHSPKQDEFLEVFC